MGGGATKTLTTSPDERGGVHRVIVQDHVVGRGRRKCVLTGHLVNSWRAGEEVVVKTLPDSVPNEEYWKDEIEKCTRLREHVLSLSKSGQPLAYSVHVEYAMTAYIDKVSQWMKRQIKVRPGEFVLVEETLGDKYDELMDAQGVISSKVPEQLSRFLAELMHFSYHESCRREVFCGFQGTYSRDRLNLAEPTVHSVEGRYRETDQGLEGILLAFQNHSCTVRCRDWLTPEGTTCKKLEKFCTTV